MWRPNTIPTAVTEKISNRERRGGKRVHAAIPLTIQLVLNPIPPPPVSVETDTISPQGLSIIIPIQTQFKQGRFFIPGGEDSIRMAQHLLLDNKQLNVGINILPQGESIPALGTVKWYTRSFDKGLYVVRTGVLIHHMEAEYTDAWQEFISAVSQFWSSLGPSRGKERRRAPFFEPVHSRVY
jgi:hypothetical protein